MNTAGSPPGPGEGRTREPLSAHATGLGPVYDLLAAYAPSGDASEPSFFFERGGLGVAGIGGLPVSDASGPDRFRQAAREVDRVLSSITPPPDGPGPVVAGAFPFDDEGRARLSLLTWAVRRTVAGETWKVEVSHAGEPVRGPDHEARVRRRTPSRDFGPGEVHPDPSGAVYAAAVRDAIGRIRAGRLKKVVLARSVTVDAGRELDVATLLWRLRAVDPDCFTFATPTRSGTLVGATPELLLSREGSVVRANPLAGSAPRFGDPDEDRASGERLLKSRKDREEHDIVADAVGSALEPFCEHLHRDGEPALVGTANVWHLSTRFEGTLRDPAPSVLELVGALHPTPAVCGRPRREAMRAIRELERFDRGFYSGPVGWVDARGDGEWALALRCAEVLGRTARLFAGAGIVADSDPGLELDESERKFLALLDSLRWG